MYTYIYICTYVAHLLGISLASAQVLLPASADGS